MKKQILSLFLVPAIILTMGILANAKNIDDIVGVTPDVKKVNEKLTELQEYTVERFSDVKTDSWFLASVSKLTALEGVSGYPDGTFKPQNATTTAEFLAMLLGTFGYKQEAGENKWYGNYVKKAEELELIYPWDDYNYEEGIKRVDMAKFICKMVGLKPAIRESVFTDVGVIADTRWIDAGFEEYLIRGYYDDGVRTYKPNQTATRAEVSEMVVRAIEYFDDPKEFKERMKKVYEESERKQGANEETTMDMFGYIVPKQGYTDLSLCWNTIEKSNKLHQVELYISVDIFAPLEKQYEQLEEILLQKFSKASVNTIMDQVKKKKERMDMFANKRFVLEDTVIWVDCTQFSVDIMVYEKGVNL